MVFKREGGDTGNPISNIPSFFTPNLPYPNFFYPNLQYPTFFTPNIPYPNLCVTPLKRGEMYVNNSKKIPNTRTIKKAVAICQRGDLPSNEKSASLYLNLPYSVVKQA